jgi:hypothetical protein
MKKTYNKMKETARERAINWQDKAISRNLSYWDIARAGNYFYKLGKRYGLLQEFRTNGIPC